jgi:hypothetical protein
VRAPLRYLAFVAFLGACRAGGRQDGAPLLLPVVTWSSETDTVLVAPLDLSVAACRLAVVDFKERHLAVKDGPGPWRIIGRRGGGPGEYESPVRVVVLPSGRVVVLDRSWQRYVVFDPDGGPTTMFPRRTPYPHPTGAQLVAIDDSTLAVYEFGARVPWGPIPDPALDSIRLIDRLDLTGEIHGGWGKPVPSITPDPRDVWRVNAGAIAIQGGRLFRLQRQTGVLEEYGLTDGILKRSDTLEALTSSPGLDGVAGGIAVLGDDRVAVVLRGSDGATPEDPFPTEQLVVLDGDRHVVSRHMLSTRLTKLVGAGGGYLFALGAATTGREDAPGMVIDLLLIPGSDSTERCGWRGAEPLR